MPLDPFASPADGHSRRELWLVVLCFAALYLIWGSTYAAIRVMLQTVPPMLGAGARYLVAGGLLYAFARGRGTPAPSARTWPAALMLGVLMLVMGNGIVTWAQQSVPSGIAATVLATNPLFAVSLQWLVFRGARPGWSVFVGLAFGIAGVALIALGGRASEHAVSWPLLVLIASPAAWALGAQLAARVPRSPSTLLATAQQMLAGGAGLVLVGIARGEQHAFAPAGLSSASVLAFAYLVVFGSIVGLSAHQWLVEHVGAARTSTYAFVNPVIALALGALMFDERLTASSALGAGCVLVAVLLILWWRTRGTVVHRGARPPAEPSHDGRPAPRAAA